MPVYGVSEGKTLSQSIKDASWELHEEAADSPYMADLMAGRLPISRYADLVVQHHFVYRALETVAEAMRSDPIAGVFVADELTRVPYLEADLQSLLGSDWASSVAPTPATREYCDRISDACFEWPGGFVAHHYVRYMGDLSGGQQIRRVVERVYGITDHSGTSFYVFDRIPDLTGFKERYRQQLDDAPWALDEQERIVTEALEAYRLNIHLLNEI
jgi:heme oxygenase